MVDISSATPKSYTPQLTMQGIIDGFDRLRPALDKLARDGDAIALDRVRLKPPLPRPGKILACIANYWEHAQREARPLNMFMKNPGRRDRTGRHHHAAGVHRAVDLHARGRAGAGDQRPGQDGEGQGLEERRVRLHRDDRRLRARTGPPHLAGEPLTSWLGKSFDTFAPIGPCIATADEIADPNDLIVRFWNDGQLRHNYNTDDMEHRVPELVEFATTVMTMNSGDLIACGTNHEGLGALQDGETVEIEIQNIGKMALKVSDPLKRTWERGVYMGADSTNPDAVKRHRPQGVDAVTYAKK